MDHSLAEQEQKPGVSLIEYCLVHGIADIATYLQEMCRDKEFRLRAIIPGYRVRTHTQEVEDIVLEPVEEWVLNMGQLRARMS